MFLEKLYSIISAFDKDIKYADYSKTEKFIIIPLGLVTITSIGIIIYGIWFIWSRDSSNILACGTILFYSTAFLQVFIIKEVYKRRFLKKEDK